MQDQLNKIVAKAKRLTDVNNHSEAMLIGAKFIAEVTNADEAFINETVAVVEEVKKMQNLRGYLDFEDSTKRYKAFNIALTRFGAIYGEAAMYALKKGY